MKRLHQGLDYKLYLVYMWGGLPVLVIYIVVFVLAGRLSRILTFLPLESMFISLQLVFDMLNLPSSAGGLCIIVPMMLWVAGMLLYWWWVLLFKGNKELKELAQMPRGDFPDIKSLKNWNTLHQAMAIHGGNVEEFIKDAKRANRPIILWWGSVNLLVVWIFAPHILVPLEVIPADAGVPGWILPAGVVAWCVLMIFATAVFLGWGSKTAEKAYLAPLGLKVTRAPGLEPAMVGLIGGGQNLILDGPAIVEGERHGRLVHIETIGKHSLTVLQAKLPEFKVQSNEGKLVADRGAPDEVLKALKSLRKAKRWKGIEVNAGPQGIGIQRYSKGTNMWLYDMWLAEYLLDKIGAG